MESKMEEDKSINGEITSDVPKSSWSFNYRSAFGWGLPVLGGALIGGKQIISQELAFNNNPVPLLIAIGISVLAFSLGGLRRRKLAEKKEVSGFESRLKNLENKS